jgi:hypothetical protein
MGQSGVAIVGKEPQVFKGSSEKKKQTVDLANCRHVVANDDSVYENLTIRRDEYRRIPYFI